MKDQPTKMPEFDACYDADTLIKAAEIRNDPERMAEAQKELASRKKAINSIEDLKDAKDALDEDSDMEDDSEDDED